MASNHPSTVDSSHQAMPPNKQVSISGVAPCAARRGLFALPAGALQTLVLGTWEKLLVCKGIKQQLLDAEVPRVPPRLLFFAHY